MHRFKISDIDQWLVQPHHEAALRRSMGSATPEDTAAGLGVDARTVEGWLYDKRLPTLPVFIRQTLHFGASFANEIFASAQPIFQDGARVLSHAELARLERALSSASLDIAKVLRPETNVTELREKVG